MKTYLHGLWQLYIPKLNETITGKVPGSVLNDLLVANKIPDPYFRLNEDLIKTWLEDDYTYTKTFEYHQKFKHTDLVLMGMDTLADIYINDTWIGQTENMHISYRFSLDQVIVNGKNTIKIIIRSALKYIEEKHRACPYDFYQAHDAVKGFIHLRKAHAQFGWDWGPQLPDAGIYRDIFLHDHDGPVIDFIHLKQDHLDHVVCVDYRIDFMGEEPYDAIIELFDETTHIIAKTNELSGRLTIEKPQLWWPIGYGKQPLYTLRVTIRGDEKEIKFGLKQSTIKREKDAFGESFIYTCNGVDIFLKGANYIIEDNVEGRINIDTSRYLLMSAVKANHNAIRIWGGGIYPSDAFYQLCDEFGIVVWQDFMFACAFYDMTDDAWLKSVKTEIVDVAKRLYHHPSLALFCGNNENETAAANWLIPNRELSKKMYVELYEKLIPNLLNSLDLNIPYWPSSPSSGGQFEDPNGEQKGDMHDWSVWHMNKPIESYRQRKTRFMSEFGIQSFPLIDTVKTFATEQDFNVYSKVMKAHQKNSTANKKIVWYMKHMFKIPTNFADKLYVSQLIQAEGVRYGVEHFRRNYGHTMGSLYWQLNDCWPVASWSSIDFTGRWKALHYHSKKFYAPIMLSIEEDRKKMSAHIYITNDSLKQIKGQLVYRLIDLEGIILTDDKKDIMVEPQSAKNHVMLDLSAYKKTKRQLLLHAAFRDENSIILTENDVTFVPDKDLALKPSNIDVKIEKHGKDFSVFLQADTVHRFVSLVYKKAVFSDNYFHLLPYRIKTITFSTNDTLDDVKQYLQVRSLIHTYQESE